MRYYVTINNKNSLELTGLYISKLPAITKPSKRATIEEIDGRDGDIITTLGYSAYDKGIEIGLVGDYDLDAIMNFFNQDGIITFSNEPERYYRFSILNKIDFEELLRFKETCGNDLILRDNDFFDCSYLDEVADYYETNFEIADRIRKCKFEVLIYNDYIE